jgi:hypothetical protein
MRPRAFLNVYITLFTSPNWFCGPFKLLFTAHLGLFPQNSNKKIAKLTGQPNLVSKIRKPEATVSWPVACSKHVAYLSSGQLFMLSMVNFNNLYKGSNYIHLHHRRPPCNTPTVVSGKASIWRHTLCYCY